MKILLITDQHFGARNDNPIFLGKFKQFYEQIVFPYIDRNNIDTVFCLGDTFDKRKSINYLSLDATREMWFKPLQDCLLYTSPSPRDMRRSRMPSSA